MLNTATSEWRQTFVSYLTLQVAFVFLTVGWELEQAVKNSHLLREDGGIHDLC